MPDTTAVHDDFVIERRYPASPERVFAAFSTLEGKNAWFSGPNDKWEKIDGHFDFRVGGSESLEGRWKSGMITRFDCDYQDIVANRRIAYAYRMKIDGKPISVSLSSIEFHPDGTGTRLVHTEHGIYLDGFEDGGGREHGISAQLDKLGSLFVMA